MDVIKVKVKIVDVEKEKMFVDDVDGGKRICEEVVVREDIQKDASLPRYDFRGVFILVET